VSEGSILAIDQGTTNSKAVLVGPDGAVHAVGSRPVPISFPRSGWVEQDADAVWASVAGAIEDALAESGRAVDVVAITNQRESALIWDRRSGEALGPLVSWQCRRSADICDRLRSDGMEQWVRALTGLPLDPLFSAGKLTWLLDHVDEARALARKGNLCFGNVDGWLLWNLTSGQVHATDASNAARTQLFDIGGLSWSAELLELFSIPAGILPEVRPSGGHFGTTSDSDGLPGGIPIASMIGDSHAALFGHGCRRPGEVKATYGTGSSLMTVTSEPHLPIRELATTVAWMREGPTYALEGNVTATGAAIDWLAELFSLDGSAEVEGLAADTTDTEGVVVVPAFAGLGAPHWDPGARGVIVGLTRGTRLRHLARAVLEAIAFQIGDVLDAMAPWADEATGVLYADGGASRSDLLMQIQADLTGWSVARAGTPHVAALGAAYLAGLAVGKWDEADVAGLIHHPDRFEPQLDPDRRGEMRAQWRAALQRTLSDEASRRARPGGSSGSDIKSTEERWPVSTS
jgi:glycerol kinase